MSRSGYGVELFYDWLAWTKTKVPPGCLDHIEKAVTDKWEIVYKEPFGRCIMAREDIAEGDTLFLDYPVLTGPKQNCGCICLGCYTCLPDVPDYLCSKCRLPMCGKECEDKGYHYLECPVFAEANFKLNLDEFKDDTSLYESILPLRCYLIKQQDEKKWRTILALESHDDLRRGSELWEVEQVNVCDFLREKVKIKCGDAQLHSITGILDVNCHEVKSSVPGTRVECRVRGLYPLCAMMSHDCFSNTHHTFTDDMTMVTVASRNIAKGEQISGIYTHLLSGTTERRKHLRYGKFFDCVCGRCRDPTELGTFFSALRCTKPGCGGDVLCKDPLQQDNKADYACTKCGNVVPVNMVSRLTNLVYYELQNIEEADITSLERIYSRYQKLLHPNHFHLIGIKHSLSQLYGRIPGFLIGEMTEQQMNRKVQCCTDVLKVIDIIDPGISRLRGLTKYELHAPLLIKANRDFQLRLLTRDHFLQQLQTALRLLQEAAYCLHFEPDSSHEGEVCKISRASVTELQQWIATVKQLPESNFLPSKEKEEEVDLSDDDVNEDDLTLEALLRKIKAF